MDYVVIKRNLEKKLNFENLQKIKIIKQIKNENYVLFK